MIFCFSVSEVYPDTGISSLQTALSYTSLCVGYVVFLISPSIAHQKRPYGTLRRWPHVQQRSLASKPWTGYLELEILKDAYDIKWNSTANMCWWLNANTNCLTVAPNENATWVSLSLLIFLFFFFFISWQDNQLVCLFTGLGCPFKLWSLVESFWRIFYRVVKSPWWVSVTAGKCFFGVTGNSSVPFFLFKQNICISLYFEILGFTTFFLLRKYSALKKEKLENHRNYSYQ